jgi:competence CoiA-like predicted nuclease
MAKAEISWRRVSEEGVRLQIYAQHVSREWRFFIREKRFDQWRSVENPALEDWLELLDSVKRRINRRLLRPEEEARVKKEIRERYPDAQFE